MKDEWGAFCRDSIALEATGAGMLAGMGFALKDVFALKGYVPGAGNPDWKRTHPLEERTSRLVEALLGAGAHLAGTAHTDELMYSLNGENYHYGTPINPRAPRRIPGGSSSGSAVAVAGGLVTFAVGTDTGGSVRIPASYCGICGYRPTHGAIDTDGLIPLAPSFDTVGLLTRDPRILLLVAQVLLPEAWAGESASSDEPAGEFAPLSTLAEGPLLSDSPSEEAAPADAPPKASASSTGESAPLCPDLSRFVPPEAACLAAQSASHAGAAPPNTELPPLSSGTYPANESLPCLIAPTPGFVSTLTIDASSADSKPQFGLDWQGLGGGGQYFARAVIGLDALGLAFPHVQGTLFALMQRLAARMTFVDRHNIAAEGLEVWAQCFRRLQGREIWRTHGDWITREQPRFGPDVAARFAWAAGLVKDGEAAGTVEDNGEGVTDCGGSMDAGILSGLSDFDANSDFSADISFNKMSNFNANSDMSDLEMRAMISRRMRNMLGEDTVLLIPTAPGPAPLRGTLGQDMEEWRTRTMQLTCIAGLAGLPQVSLPVIGPDGLLIGLSVIAGAAQDIKLLRWVVELVDAGLVDAGLVVPEEATAYE